jgi:hypothetical protein
MRRRHCARRGRGSRNQPYPLSAGAASLAGARAECHTACNARRCPLAGRHCHVYGDPMHRLIRVAATCAAVILLAAAAAVITPAAAHAAGGGGGTNNCSAYSQGLSYLVGCSNLGSPGSGSGAGTTGTAACNPDGAMFLLSYWDPTLYNQLTKSQPAPAGYSYFILVFSDPECLAGVGTVGNFAINLLRNGGALTPANLANQAWAEITPPPPAPDTAPPRGKDALVGLPTWFWVAAPQWQPIVRSVAVGGVFATVTAKPTTLSFSPGAGLPSFACQGPGTAYNPSLAASAQQTACSYLFSQPSAGQPGNAYQVTVTITWTATWTGSGGAGGALPDITRSVTFALPVAQGEALYTGGSSA